MSNTPPSQSDRLISHAIVGIAAGAVVGSKKGWAGFIVAMIVTVMAHEALDAPVAGLVADLDLG